MLPVTLTSPTTPDARRLAQAVVVESEMQRGDLGRDCGFLFRERIQQVVRSQTGLDMADRDLLVKRCESSGEGWWVSPCTSTG